MERRVGLRPLLVGPPLTERDAGADATARSLESHMLGLAELLPKVYGDTPACAQAVAEVEALGGMVPGPDEVVCKRAALLFAVLQEKEVGKYFALQERRVERCAGGPTFAEDMRERVLPFLMPQFLRNSCQTPDAMVAMAMVLNEMWAGERLGNWPLSGAHHDAAIGQLYQGGDGKGG